MHSACKKIIAFCLVCFLFVTSFAFSTEAEASAVPLDDEVVAAARALCADYGIDPALLWAIIETESGFNIYSGNSYCKGLMAVHKSYAAYYAEKAGMSSYSLFDPIDNIHIGLEMLKEHIDTYGDTSDALIAYNNGSGGAQYYFKQGIHSTSYSRRVNERRAKWAQVEAAETAASTAEQEAAEEAARLAAEQEAAEEAARLAAEQEAAEEAARLAAEQKAAEEAALNARLTAEDEAKVLSIPTIGFSAKEEEVTVLSISTIVISDEVEKLYNLKIIRLSDLFV